MTISSYLTILVLASVLVGSFSYLYIVPSEIGKSKDHEGYCYYGDKKMLLKKGETVNKNCEEISCNDDYSIRIAGCGTTTIIDPSCKRFERDFTKPYPYCCTALYCAEPVENYDAKHQSKVDKNILY